MKLIKIILAVVMLSTLLVAAKYNKEKDLKDCANDKSICMKECNKNRKLYENINSCYLICKTNNDTCVKMAEEEAKLYIK